MDKNTLEAFLGAYIECALWSTTDESNDAGGEPLDANYTEADLSQECLGTMQQDCARFIEQNAEHIGDAIERAGHDFWLTRNGHGAGFWDGDWPEPAATRLTEASKAFGEVYLVVGDDGRIWS